MLVNGHALRGAETLKRSLIDTLSHNIIFLYFLPPSAVRPLSVTLP